MSSKPAQRARCVLSSGFVCLLASVAASAIGQEAPTTEGLQFNDYNLMVQAAIAGQGVILGSRPVLGDLLEAGLLVDPIPESAVTDIGYDLVTTDTALARAEVASFRDWIVETAKA